MMHAEQREAVNILLVDDQPAKLLSYQAILGDLGETLIVAGSARDALDLLLKHEIAVVLMDVCMPEIDGFELAEMIHEHPRCRRTALIFVSGVHLTDIDRLKGYELGAVDYVTVPIVPEILRAKVSVFASLHRTTKELERLNRELEARVAERTEALVSSNNELRLREERLREADRRKDEFLAMLAHELRNPLAPIRTAAQLLRVESLGDAQRTRARDVIERQVEHMVRLIDDLMDVTRITTGKIILKRDRIDLRTVVVRAIELSRPRIDAKQLQLTTVLPDEPIDAEVDATRLIQAIGNLLDNAAKYTDGGGQIRIELAHDDGDATVRVIDTGSGIAPEILPDVFDLFTQARPTTERSGGLGLGLALVRRIVEMHGGGVTARSDGVGRGSEFVLRLRECVDSKPAPSEATGVRERPDTLDRRRILVADDNRELTETLALFLQAAGHDVHVCYDGQQAVMAAESFRPEIVLLDIGMPVMDGCDAAEAIRKQAWGAKMILVALTGWGQERDRARTKQAGFDEHLVKPVDGAHLLQVLARLAGESAKVRASARS